MDQPVILTERLKLRALRSSDAGLLALYASDLRLARMTPSIPHPYPPGSAENYIRRTMEGRGSKRVWAMDHLGSADGELVGVISLRESGELGYWVGAPFWSTGFATEAVDAVVNLAPQMGHPTLNANVMQDNLASAKVLTKAGFTYTGDGEVYSTARGATVPIWNYRLETNA